MWYTIVRNLQNNIPHFVYFTQFLEHTTFYLEKWCQQAFPQTELFCSQHCKFKTVMQISFLQQT